LLSECVRAAQDHEIVSIAHNETVEKVSLWRLISAKREIFARILRPMGL
jgi:hypothetical protein